MTKLFDVVDSRKRRDRTTIASIVYTIRFTMPSYKANARSDREEKVSRMKATGGSRKKLYQMNITIWCVKPITISTHTRTHAHTLKRQHQRLNFWYPLSQCIAVKSA